MLEKLTDKSGAVITNTRRKYVQINWNRPFDRANVRDSYVLWCTQRSNNTHGILCICQCGFNMNHLINHNHLKKMKNSHKKYCSNLNDRFLYFCIQNWAVNYCGFNLDQRTKFVINRQGTYTQFLIYLVKCKEKLLCVSANRSL